MKQKLTLARLSCFRNGFTGVVVFLSRLSVLRPCDKDPVPESALRGLDWLSRLILSGSSLSLLPPEWELTLLCTEYPLSLLGILTIGLRPLPWFCIVFPFIVTVPDLESVPTFESLESLLLLVPFDCFVSSGGFHFVALASFSFASSFSLASLASLASFSLASFASFAFASFTASFLSFSSFSYINSFKMIELNQSLSMFKSFPIRLLPWTHYISLETMFLRIAIANFKFVVMYWYIWRYMKVIFNMNIKPI